MRLTLAVVGKPRDAGIREALREYEARAARYWPLEVHEVREEPARSLAPAQVKAREGERLAARVASAAIVACDVGGTSMSSERFAAWLQQKREDGRDLGIVIGGAYGLSDELRVRATLRLSLAPWTLPHELARLVLVEQLYRAGTIVRGEPYHK